jgi:ankyrin repeat protein
MARTNDAQLLDYIRAGVPPNMLNNRGDSFLMLAAYHGHTDLVAPLLELGADANQLNGRGQSCVAGAVFKDFPEVVRALIAGGADPLAGQPNAEDTARMFNKLDGDAGFAALFAQAPGRGAGSTPAPAAVEDREEARRVPGSGPVGEQQAPASG